MRDYEFLGKALFTLDEAAREFNSRSALYGALRRASERGEIRKIAGGLYCAVNSFTNSILASKYEIGTALRPGGYLAYHTALEYHGLAKPATDKVQVVGTRQENPVRIDGKEYRTYLSSNDFGIMETRGHAPVRVTDLERTMLDCLDRLELAGGLQEVFKAISKVTFADEGKLLEYLELYDRKFLYKKTGYILSVIDPPFISEGFMDTCRKRASLRIDDIRPSKGISTIFSKEWNLYVPASIAKKRRKVKPQEPAGEDPASEAPADLFSLEAAPAESGPCDMSGDMTAALEASPAEAPDIPASSEASAESPAEDSG
ncbi:MAG: hypothetical protein LUE27_07320 [Clostridia bacterium]|nr:hypothetical protein [Clostridia bacterium]MCD8295033.1 hypothetical protein [Clostridia bacterium]